MSKYGCFTALGKRHFHKDQHQIGCFTALTNDLLNIGKDVPPYAEMPSIEIPTTNYHA